MFNKIDIPELYSLLSLNLIEYLFNVDFQKLKLNYFIFIF